MLTWTSHTSQAGRIGDQARGNLGSWQRREGRTEGSARNQTERARTVFNEAKSNVDVLTQELDLLTSNKRTLENQLEEAKTNLAAAQSKGGEMIVRGSYAVLLLACLQVTCARTKALACCSFRHISPVPSHNLLHDDDTVHNNHQLDIDDDNGDDHHHHRSSFPG